MVALKASGAERIVKIYWLEISEREIFDGKQRLEHPLVVVNVDKELHGAQDGRKMAITDAEGAFSKLTEAMCSICSKLGHLRIVWQLVAPWWMVTARRSS